MMMVPYRIMMTMTQQKSGQEDRLTLELYLFILPAGDRRSISFGADAMSPFTVFILGTLVLLSSTTAFQVSIPSGHRSTYMILPKAAPQRQSRSQFFVQRPFSPLWASPDDEANVLNEMESSDSMPVIVRGSEEDDLDDATWEDIETGQPPEWMVMKEVSQSIWWKYQGLSIVPFSNSLARFVVFLVDGNQYIYLRAWGAHRLFSKHELFSGTGVAGTRLWNPRDREHRRGIQVTSGRCRS